MSVIKFSAHKKFHLLQIKTRAWETGPEQLQHYRIIFILSGQGQFALESTIHSYAKSGIIYLKPGQQPVFQEDNNTEILIIGFDTYLADDFQRKKKFSPDFADTYKQAENLCRSILLPQGKPLANERDGQTVNYLVSQICFEITQRPSSHLKLIKGSIDLIVTMLARNNFTIRKPEEKTSQQVLTEHLVEYVRQELHHNRSVRIPEVLLRFNISEEVANLHVMNRTGMSLRNFIFKYKADLFKSRLLKVDVMELSPYLRPR